MKSDSPLWHAKHVVRACLLLVVGIVALVALRSFLVPPSWGDQGWFRADNLQEQRDHPLLHRGDDACLECHEDEHAVHAAAGHASVRCELCHGPVGIHVVDGEHAVEMPVRREATLCLECHRQLDARPDGFPQISPRDHVEEQGGEYGDAVCFDCHDAHEPL